MNISREIYLFTLNATFAGSAAAAWPSLVRVDSINVPFASSLVGVFLSSNIDVSSSNAGFFVIPNLAPPVLQITNSLPSVAHHIGQSPNGGGVVGLDTFADFRDAQVYIPAGGKISLYASGTAAIITAMVAVANLQIARVVP